MLAELIAASRKPPVKLYPDLTLGTGQRRIQDIDTVFTAGL